MHFNASTISGSGLLLAMYRSISAALSEFRDNEMSLEAIRDNIPNAFALVS